MYADPGGSLQGPRSMHFRRKRPILRLPELAHAAALGRWRGRSPRLGAVDLGRIVAEAPPLRAEAGIPVDEDTVHVEENRGRRELVRHRFVPPDHEGNRELLEMLHASLPHPLSEVMVVSQFLTRLNSAIKIALLQQKPKIF